MSDAATRDWASTALLLCDLQNDFIHPDGAYGRAGQTAPEIAALPGRIRPLIMVAVANTPDRMAEYTPARDERFQAGGKGDLYARFLLEELKPAIDREYATLPGKGPPADWWAVPEGLVRSVVGWLVLPAMAT